MTTKFIFTSSTEVLPKPGGALPSRIEIMPLGPLRLDDQRGEVGRLTDAASLVARTMAAAKGGVLPIDFGHGMDGLGTGDQRAAGWITGLDVEKDRVMATVEWTLPGEQALRDRTYRFISPTFTVPTDGGEVGVILRAGLTNNPAFRELAKLASTQEKTSMPQWLKLLAAKLGMPEETDEAKIAAAAESAIDQAGRAAGIVTAAGLTGDLTETAATAITAKIAASTPDPAKFVPVEAVRQLTGDLASLRQQIDGDKAQAVVAAALASGKVPPSLEEWAATYAASDLKGFETYLASVRPIVGGGRVTPDGKPPNGDGILSAEERSVCAATGVSEAAFLATKQGKPLPQKKEG